MKNKIALLFAMSLATLAFAANQGSPNGQAVYARACKTCHAPDVATALGAPAAFDVKTWQRRLLIANRVAAQSPRFASGQAYLLYQVKIGKGLMHHKGLCLESRRQHKQDCSDKSLLSAIQYMSHKSP